MAPHANGITTNGHGPTNGNHNHSHNQNGNEKTNTQSPNRSNLRRVSSEERYDLVCVGFGPANLALAIALHDALDDPTNAPAALRTRPPRVLFLEKQEQYGWHEGMLLPGATMQISFIKDLATIRNPRSEFTFINYLHRKNRLLQFTNLDTFLPQRVEYADYMKWCAAWFDEVVEYGQEVVSITPNKTSSKSSEVQSFAVQAKDVHHGSTQTFSAKHVVIAVGGKPNIPAPFPSDNPRVLHSSWYANVISKALPDPSKDYNIAVIGGGQSAAEIFNDLHTRYSNSHTHLVMKAAALKPSDDSPFVNELFDPNRVDAFYPMPASLRHAQITDNRATNYGVVRPKLIEHIYETLYMQRLRHPNEADWQHRIVNQHAVVAVETSYSSDADQVELQLRDIAADGPQSGKEIDLAPTSRLAADAVIVAAGYLRDAHETLLAPAKKLQPTGSHDDKWKVRRDYSVEFAEGAVSPHAGVWLAGCNESTHGLSDSLLSILATRGGDLVKSIFDR